MRSWKFLLPLLASTVCFAAQPNRISGVINSAQVVMLNGQIPHKAKPQYDVGRVAPSFQLSQITLLTMPTPSQQAALRLLVSEQQNPKSPNFHKWITPEQYADQFGLSQNDVQNISKWLKSQGLSVVNVARGRNWIVFSGTAAQVEAAFRTELHRYTVDGDTHFANATAPSIPAALSGIVTGFRGLDNFLPKPMNVKRAGARSQNASPNYYDGNLGGEPDFLAPGDIATIYDLQTLYNSGITGAGQKLAIIGETDVYLADLNAFRTGFGLNPISGCTTDTAGLITSCSASSTYLQYVVVGTDLGAPSTCSDLSEADLDLEWSGATAREAQIIYVNAPVTYNAQCNEILSGSGVFGAFYYAIDNNLAPVISMSYGAPCEFDDNNLAGDEIELTKSNSFGITFMNSSGDSGAASCDSPVNSQTNNLAVGGLAVSYPASSPEVTAVGGTAISYPAGFTSTYWNTTNGVFPNGGTAQNPPVPETSWNDDVELAAEFNSTQLAEQQSYAIVSSGGGASNCSVQTSDFSECVSGFPQPSWQTVTVPSQASARFVPDISLLAAPNFPGYVFCTPLDQLSSTAPYDTETTSSCGTGTSADMQTAVNGIVSGSSFVVNPSIIGGTSASSPIFAGIVTLLNQYLGASGLGNINPTLYTLAHTTSNGAFHQVTTGTNVVYCEGGTPVAPWPPALVCPGATGTTGSIGYQASNADTVTGYNLVTGLGSIDANALFTAWAASLAPDFALTPSQNSISIVAGHSTPITLTISAISGSTGTVVNFSPSSCTGLPAGATCSFSSTSVPFDGTDPATIGLTISTLANMALPSGATTITITPTSPSNVSTTISLTVTATNQSFTIAPGTSTYSVTAGGAATVLITVTPTNGFSTSLLPLSYSCTGLPSETTGSFSPGSSTGSCVSGVPNSTNAVTLTIKTTAPTAQLHPPLERGNRMFYAMLLPGVFGILLVAGGSKRSSRLLGLIVVLGISTLWLGSCGGSSGGGSTKDPGTPAGTYSVVVNASTAVPTGGTALTGTFTVTLTVQ